MSSSFNMGQPTQSLQSLPEASSLPSQGDDQDLYLLDGSSSSTDLLGLYQPTSSLGSPPLSPLTTRGLATPRSAASGSSSTSMSDTADLAVAGRSSDRLRSWVFKNKWAARECTIKGGVKHFVTTCLHPGCSVVYRNKDGSTGNMLKHLQDDHYVDSTVVNSPDFKPREGPMDNMVIRGVKRAAEPWSKKDFEDAYIKFFVTSRSPFRLIRNPSLQQMLDLASGAPSKAFIQLPSDNTLRRKITTKYHELRDSIISVLESVPKVALTLDGWTDAYLKSFLCITAHWIDDTWTHREVVIGFEALHGSHNAELLLDALIVVVQRFGLQKKILSITTDNAANVTLMMKRLGVYTAKTDEWNTFNAKQQHIPCLGHIINLAVQAFLGKNGLRATAPKESVEHNDDDDKDDVEVLPAPDDDEEDDADEDADAANAVVGASEIVATGTSASSVADVSASSITSATVSASAIDDTEPRSPVTLLHTGIGLDDAETEAEHFDETPSPVSTCPLWKLRKGVIKIRSSQSRLDRFHKGAREHSASREYGDLVLVLDVRTRWNSTHRMIKRALLLRGAYDELCEDEADIADCILDDNDWNYLQQLAELLERFDKLTTMVSASIAYSTIPFTIFVYNDLLDHLEDFIDKYEELGTLPDMVAAARAAKEKMMKYYVKTDLTPIYSIATAMHPNMRFSYWKEQEWEDQYQEAAQKMVRDEWSASYAGAPTSSVSTAPPGSPGTQPGGSNGGRGIQGGIMSRRMRAREPNLGELDKYVAAIDQNPDENDDPSPFWRVFQAMWPSVANMARDYLAVPATSTPSERCFSKAKLILPHNRNRLSRKKIKELILTESWFGFFDKCIKPQE